MPQPLIPRAIENRSIPIVFTRLRERAVFNSSRKDKRSRSSVCGVQEYDSRAGICSPHRSTGCRAADGKEVRRPATRRAILRRGRRAGRSPLGAKHTRPTPGTPIANIHLPTSRQIDFHLIAVLFGGQRRQGSGGWRNRRSLKLGASEALGQMPPVMD